MASSKTPIKVRGKGPRKKRWVPPPKKITQKRPRSDIETPDFDPAREERRKRRKAKLALKTASAAPIERLPKEILEDIFLRSSNLNFPKSSHRIGLGLSDTSTLTRLIANGFGPTWDVWLGVLPHQVQSYHGWFLDKKRFGGDPRFQSAILACSWMNVDLMLASQRLWFRREQRQRKKQGTTLHYAQLETTIPGASGQDATEEAIQKCFDHEWSSHAAWADHLLSVGEHLLEPDCRGADLQLLDYWARYNQLSLDAHVDIAVPDHLFRGRLQTEHIKLLCWLVRQGIKLPERSHLWELTKIGYETIMESENDPRLVLIALGVFRCLGVFDGWPKLVVSKKLQEAMVEGKIRKSSRDCARWVVAEAMLKSAYNRHDAAPAKLTANVF